MIHTDIFKAADYTPPNTNPYFASWKLQVCSVTEYAIRA